MAYPQVLRTASKTLIRDEILMKIYVGTESHNRGPVLIVIYVIQESVKPLLQDLVE